MKKVFLTIIALAIALQSFGQWTLSGSDIYNSNAGNVGIGTTSPLSKFQVRTGTNENFRIRPGTDIGAVNGVTLYSRNDADDALMQLSLRGSDIVMLPSGNVGIGTASPGSTLDVVGAMTTSKASGGEVRFSGVSGYYSFMTSAMVRGANQWTISRLGTDGDASNDAVTADLLTVDYTGNVGIGTTNPGSYKLAVNGYIRAKEIKVETGWSDFVFEPDYKLLSLKETEDYIKKNRHLPEIPSAKEVEKEGINVGEMNAKLLQKIEELTLHLIEMSKNQKLLEQQVQVQQREIEKLKPAK